MCVCFLPGKDAPCSELVEDPLGLMGVPCNCRLMDVEPECDCGLLWTCGTNSESMERTDRIECEKLSRQASSLTSQRGCKH